MSEASICDNNPLISYSNRVDNPDGYNWCLVPDGGADAVFFAGVAIVAMCLANPRWDALITLVAGAVYEVFAFKFNLGHVSNAVSLWLGMRPSDIFVYVFFPPFLLDLASRIDFYMLKKTMVSVLMMAFVMVVASALLLIPLMLYGLDLQSRGWTAAHVALFGAMIASTDAASVSAALRSGGGPEILSVLLEGESLLNDASSLTLFEIFSKIVATSENVSLSHELSNITVDILYASFTAMCIGLGMGLFNKYVFLWLQHRNIPPQAEVAFTVAGSYLCYYITQVWCGGSGVIAVVVYGLYGSSTLTWGISSRARLEGTFKQFWVVLVFMINGLIFFYVGAASVNFTWRASDTLFTDKTQGLELVLIVFYKLPIIYLASFAMRLVFISVSFTVLKWMHLSDGLTWQEMVFVTVGGLRGSLSLVLAEAVSTAASAGTDERVKAETAIFTTGYVLLTLLINQPLCGPLLTVLGLNKVKQEQLHMRHQVKSMFLKYTTTTIEDLKADQEEDEMLQGVDCESVTAGCPRGGPGVGGSGGRQVIVIKAAGVLGRSISPSSRAAVRCKHLPQDDRQRARVSSSRQRTCVFQQAARTCVFQQAAHVCLPAGSARVSSSRQRTCVFQQAAHSCVSQQAAHTCVFQQAAHTCVSQQAAHTCVFQQAARTCVFQQAAHACVFLQAARTCVFLQAAHVCLPAGSAHVCLPTGSRWGVSDPGRGQVGACEGVAQGPVRAWAPSCGERMLRTQEALRTSTSFAHTSHRCDRCCTSVLHRSGRDGVMDRRMLTRLPATPAAYRSGTVVEGHTDFTAELDLTLPSVQPSVPTYSTMWERLSGWNQVAGRTLASLHRRLRSCCTSPGRDAARNETAEEAQGRLKSAAILNRTTRQSMSLMLTSPSRRSVMWPGGGGFEAEAVAAEPVSLCPYRDGVFNMCRNVVEGMLTRGFGRIVNISSVNGQTGQFGQTNYSAAKAGVHGFSMALARETASKGVTVNTVSPGYCDTSMVAAVSAEVRGQIITSIPVGRLGTPADIARAVNFFSEDDNGYITGANLPVNGGYFMSF
ncbi:MAG: hypothetical protein WDW36_005582 [Sanguina aurantia]